MTTEYKVYLDEIEELQSKANFKTERFLQERGWKKTCNNIGSVWLWVKEFDKGGESQSYRCSMRDALNYEKRYFGKDAHPIYRDAPHDE